MNKEKEPKTDEEFERSILDRVYIIDELFAYKKSKKFINGIKNNALDFYQEEAILTTDRSLQSYFIINLYKFTSCSHNDVNSINILIKELESENYDKLFHKIPDIHYIKSEFNKIKKKWKKVIKNQRNKYYAHLDSFTNRNNIDLEMSISFETLYFIIDILSNITFYVAECITKDFEDWNGRTDNIHYKKSNKKTEFIKLKENVDQLYLNTIILDGLNKIFEENPNANFIEERNKIFKKYKDLSNSYILK